MAPRWYKDAVSKVRGTETEKRPFQTLGDLDTMVEVEVDLDDELDDLESQRDDRSEGAGPSSSRWDRGRSISGAKEGSSPRRKDDDDAIRLSTTSPVDDDDDDEHGRSLRSRARSIVNPILNIAHWKGLTTVREAAEEAADAALDDVDERSAKEKDRTNPKMRRIAEARFSVIESRVDSLVNGAIKRAVAVDPWMPPEVSNALLSSWAVVWNETVDAMRDEYIAKHATDGYREAKRALMDLSAWPPYPAACAEDDDECECGSCGAVHASCARGAQERFVAALRARYLYALLPADKSIWWQLARPLPIAIFVSLVAPFGISTFAWLVFFLAIDRTDEYQLINFAILFKTVSFVKWGLLPLLTNYFFLYACASVGRCDDDVRFGWAWGALDRLNTFSMSLFCFSWLLSWSAFALYKRARNSNGGRG